MIIVKSLLIPILLLAPVVVSVKHGTIGYGINMYRPWCCSSCHNVLSMLYLNCTTFPQQHSHNHDGMDMDMKLIKRMDMDMEMEGTTSDECYASDQAYLQSFAFCVRTRCDEEGVARDEQDRCFQKLAANELPVKSLQASLPSTVPVEELDEKAEWLNKTMLVNSESWLVDRGTIEAFERSEEDHVKFSIVIVAFSVAITILTKLWSTAYSICLVRSQKAKILSWVQTYITLPALGGAKHLQPLPGSIGYAPHRGMTIFITIYVLLNVVFSAGPYHSIQPSAWFSGLNDEIGAYVANRTGVLSFANMALAILFSMRNSPLAWCSNWSQTSFLTFHRWAARMAVLQAVVHSIVYTADYVYYMGSNKYAAEAAKPYFWWGIIATTAMGLMVGASVLPLRRYCYELFLIVHIVLAIVSLLGSWYHVDIRFEKKWGYEVWLYLAFAFWSYDRLTRLTKLIYHTVVGRPEAVLQSIPGTNIVQLTIHLKKSWSIGPGGHTFIYFPSLGKFWENHPFSIADWSTSNQLYRPEADPSTSNKQQQETSSDTESNDICSAEDSSKQDALVCEKQIKHAGSQLINNKPFIRCYFRVHKGMTSQIYRKLSGLNTSKITALTEGPYGSHISSHGPLKTADRILCITGGIGITWAAGFVKQFALDRLDAKQSKHALMPRCQQFTLAWSVREDGLMTHFRDSVLPQLDHSASGLDDGSMRYRFWVTDSSNGTGQSGSGKEAVQTMVEEQDTLVSTATGRLDVEAEITSFMSQGKKHVILVCGPGSLADKVRSQVVSCSRQGYTVDLIEEAFAW